MNQVDSKRTLLAWAMYDFANSAFATLVVTFIYGAYFTKEIAPDEMLGHSIVVLGNSCHRDNRICFITYFRCFVRFRRV